MTLIPNGGMPWLTHQRKLALAVGIYLSAFSTASVALFAPVTSPRASFAEWAMFVGALGTAIKAIFTWGNAAEHRANAAAVNGVNGGGNGKPPTQPA